MEAQPITLAVKAHFENVHPKTEGQLILTEYGTKSSAKDIGAGNTNVDKAHSEIVHRTTEGLQHLTSGVWSQVLPLACSLCWHEIARVPRRPILKLSLQSGRRSPCVCPAAQLWAEKNTK